MKTYVAIALLGCIDIAARSAPDAGPLAGLPSPLGPHVEKIKALRSNEWLELGCPAADPRWGKEGIARGRAWGGRSICSASGLGGAFFCGTGVHGYVKTDGHYMDDLWFYDINAHRWICLYPGASKQTKLTLDKNGFEVNESGDPIPISYLSHAYGNMTYDSDLRKLLIIWSQCPWWGSAVPQRWEWLGIPEDQRAYGSAGPVIANGRHPLFWDVSTGKWERRFVSEHGGFETRGAAWGHLTEYVPSMKRTFHGGACYHGSRGHAGWFYEYGSNRWIQAKTAQPQSMGPAGHNGCYDSKRERIYSLGGARMSYFDLSSNVWVEVKGKSQPEDFGSSNNGRLTFDAASGKLVWHPGDGEKGNVRIYDSDADAWEKPERRLPKPAYRGMVHGFYDEKLNAHFYYLAGDSGNEGTTMLVYRYRPGSE